MDEIYLDNAATTKPFAEVVEVIADCLVNKYGNPSSLHRKGIEAEGLLRDSREAVARVLGVEPGEIYFTSGGTESNNAAIRGITESYSNRGKHIITSKIEHPSVLRTMEDLEGKGFEVTYLDVGDTGLIDLEQLKGSMRKDTILVSVMGVNNEIGSVQPVEKAGQIIKRENPLTFFHVDGIQAFLKIPVKPKSMGIDLFSLSGHKFHGPKGIGALYCRKGVNLRPVQTGGGQERGLRAGTENTPGIAGLGKAVEIYSQNHYEYNLRLKTLKEMLKSGIELRIPNIRVNTPSDDDGAPHILSIAFCGVKGEVLLHSLEKHGIYISTRSACSSKQNKVSSVLSAIGLTGEEMEGTVRISLSPFNSEEQMQKTVDAFDTEVKNLRKMFRR